MHQLRKVALDIDNETQHAHIYFAVITDQEWATLKQSQLNTTKHLSQDSSTLHASNMQTHNTVTSDCI